MLGVLNSSNCDFSIKAPRALEVLLHLLFLSLSAAFQLIKLAYIKPNNKPESYGGGVLF